MRKSNSYFNLFPMFRRIASFNGGLRVLIIVVLFQFQIQTTCPASLNHQCTSSCGKAHNISKPFRVKNDPENCGDPLYEIDCENNVAMKSLYLGKYYVESIDYYNKTIRLVDPGVHENNNCSSTPHYLLSSRNFSGINYNPKEDLHIYYISCGEAVNDPLYVSTGACSDENPREHNYAVVDEYLTAKELRVGCRVKMVALTYWPSEELKGGRKVFFAEIHNHLVHGFQLSWSSWQETTYGAYSFIAIIGIERSGLSAIWRILLDYTIYFSIMASYSIEFLQAAKVTLGTPCVIILLFYKWRRRHLSMYNTIEEFLQNNNNMMPIRYSYSEIKNMTRGFKNKLGEGGFGTVFIGKLRSGHMVAIKMLGKSRANGQDFISEVATIGRIHHVNVVQLIGYCVEGSKHALVYDFMFNGSLDKYIFSKEGSIPIRTKKIYDIAIGVARGIAYLHQGCDMQILHFDIKPHNILLDEDFTPKVSDFGLAKLYPTNESIVSLTAARGTIGYMAPELFYKNIGGVSYKADVYSFGMLLLEMAGRRRNLNPFAEDSSQIHFPSWVYDQFISGNELEIVDTDEEEKELAKKMIIVSFWCIQIRPSDRPSMKKVVEMLESEVDYLEMPPKPFLSVEDLPSEHASIHSKSTGPSSVHSCSSSESESLVLNAI